MLAPPAASEIGLAELVGALSRALDITEGQPAGHGVRCCWIGMHVGRAIGLSEGQMSDLYYALLLKDVGCSSNAARICQLYLADDLSFKDDHKRMGDALPQVLRFVLSHTGMQAGLAARFRAILNIAMNGGEIARELIETRCHQGADIARQMRFPEPVQQAILDLDEHWDGGGHPIGLSGTAIFPFARIALMAQVIDVFHTSAGRDGAVAEVTARSGTWFDPALVHIFVEVARDDRFWAGLAASDLPQRVVALEPFHAARSVDDDYLDDVAAGFAKVIDAKSPFTSGHSDRVALFADLIAEELGFSADRRRWLKRAALLHDIGKLGVSNQILDKPAKLDPDEWVQMRRHSELGEEILSRIAAFSGLSRVAGAHHERLDGTGYPRGLKDKAIDLDTRIVTVSDIFDALTAERPYRAAIPMSRAFVMMFGMTGSAIDGEVLAALQRAMARAESVAA